jgi:hypothetical protein
MAGILLSARSGMAAPGAVVPLVTDQRTSSCGGVVTATLNPVEALLCDRLTIVARVDPICPVCPNGVNVVFVQSENTLEFRWMREQSVEALNALIQYSTFMPEVGVVHYGEDVRRRLELTPNLGQARGPLTEPGLGNGYGDWEGAAREALDMLREARGLGQPSDEQCEFVIFFATSKPYPEQGAAMLRAAQAIHREGVALFVGCPGPPPQYCQHTRRMPQNPSYYTETPEGGKLASMVRRSMDALEGNATLHSLELTQLLAAGLNYITGSASVSPTALVNLDDGRTELRWVLGTRNVPVAPQTVTYMAMPLAQGQRSGHDGPVASRRIVHGDRV